MSQTDTTLPQWLTDFETENSFTIPSSMHAYIVEQLDINLINDKKTLILVSANVTSMSSTFPLTGPREQLRELIRTSLSSSGGAGGGAGAASTNSSDDQDQRRRRQRDENQQQNQPGGFPQPQNNKQNQAPPQPPQPRPPSSSDDVSMIYVKVSKFATGSLEGLEKEDFKMRMRQYLDSSDFCKGFRKAKNSDFGFLVFVGTNAVSAVDLRDDVYDRLKNDNSYYFAKSDKPLEGGYDTDSLYISNDD